MATPEENQDYLIRKEIGGRLRLLRKQKILTQEDLAALIGTSRETVSQYESGSRGIAAHDLPRIARALKITIGQLFDEHPVPFVQAVSTFDFNKLKDVPTSHLYPGMSVTENEWIAFAYITAMNHEDQQVARKILRVLWEEYTNGSSTSEPE